MSGQDSTVGSERAARMGARFVELHQSGCFLMVNVADPVTAVAVQKAGASAVASTSSAHANQIGRSDAAGEVSMAEHAEHVAVLTAAVDVPLNVDAENGYGHEPEDMALAVQTFAEAGAAGMGIEDWSGDPDRGSYERSLAVARIDAAVEAANALPHPFVITGRTDILINDHEGDFDEALARLQAFAAVGAHCLYATGLRDIASIERFAANAGGPTNVLVPVGSELSGLDVGAAGARRISIGGSLYFAQATYGGRVVESILKTGSFSPIA